MKTQTYEKIQNSGTDNGSVTQYLGMVTRIALFLRNRVPNYIDTDDMIQLGIIGLIEAQKKFDPAGGVSFESFAKSRIKGAILDEVRRMSNQSRLAVRNVKSHHQAAMRLANTLGRMPSNREVAEHLGISVDELERQRTHANTFDMQALDGMYDGEEYEIEDHCRTVFEHVAGSEIKQALVEAMAELDERRQLILSLYFVEELNLKEIGAVIGVNESRVSQLLSGSIKKLRTTLAEKHGESIAA